MTGSLQKQNEHDLKIVQNRERIEGLGDMNVEKAGKDGGPDELHDTPGITELEQAKNN